MDNMDEGNQPGGVWCAVCCCSRLEWCVLECGHASCLRCMGRWLQSHDSCMECRASPVHCRPLFMPEEPVAVAAPQPPQPPPPKPPAPAPQPPAPAPLAQPVVAEPKQPVEVLNALHAVQA